ncbi:MAG TPA: Wall-associated protein precursor [Archangium sp.]|uniref:Wall-associated protein precursor n=1 Tax=Archangium sp. TaxID=1872627 RepID=UPI002E3424EE|nr:Wall-associated protein precursor [Archangium sp.]HEX5746363.1 Wall-associated protein precursor [Archangium sp.]
MVGTHTTGRVLVLCMLAVLASVTAGCSVGAHSTASSPSAASSPVYLAQVTCWNTMSCCIQRWPLNAAEQCGASAAEIAEVLNGARVLHEMTQPEGDRLEEETQAPSDAEVAEDSGEPPHCTGQNHHIISRPISEELEQHKTLRGLYTPRDERFVTRAKDRESHCGYQQWHRDVDREVIEWLQRFPKATRKEFEDFLRGIYSRPEMLKRFPNGFPGR